MLFVVILFILDLLELLRGFLGLVFIGLLCVGFIGGLAFDCWWV